MKTVVKLLNLILRLFGLYAYWHSQNLNPEFDADQERIEQCPQWQYGRGWLVIRDVDDVHSTTFGLEWLFGKRCSGTRLQLSLDGLDGPRVVLSIGVYRLFSFYPSIEAGWLRRFMPWHWEESRVRLGEKWQCPEERQIGFSIHDGIIWISLWENATEWSNSNPWWWQFSFNPADVFLGQYKYSERDLENGTVDIKMPEGNYRARYTVSESTWKRPRWPWPKRVVRTEIEPEIAVPVPGKGENSWDLDDDAIYSGSYPAASGEEAAYLLSQSALRIRRRYAGRGWVPDAGWPVKDE